MNKTAFLLVFVVWRSCPASQRRHCGRRDYCSREQSDRDALGVPAQPRTAQSRKLSSRLRTTPIGPTRKSNAMCFATSSISSFFSRRAKTLVITADTELVKYLDEMRKQMNLESMEDLEKAAQPQGVSFEDFKQNRRNQIITQQVIGREVGHTSQHHQGRRAKVLRRAPC